MSTSTSSGVCSCISVLNQQSETLHYQNQSDRSCPPCATASKKCTVVENGRVIVKPIQPDVMASKEISDKEVTNPGKPPKSPNSGGL
ncbi:hypothetical protein [Phormidesmis priestleyi]